MTWIRMMQMKLFISTKSANCVFQDAVFIDICLESDSSRSLMDIRIPLSWMTGGCCGEEVE